MVTHNENTNRISDDTKQEMIREALQVDAADIALANREGFRSLGSLVQLMPKLRIKVIGELRRRNLLIIPHYLVDIRIYFRMEDEPHQVRRRSIC